jgi:2-iminobutanoate/2-iminopropanoate deaminase
LEGELFMKKREAIVLDKSVNRHRLFSDAIKVGDFLFASGVSPVDSRTGKTVGEDILAQTRQTLENCKLVLKRVGGELEKVVKITIFLKNMDDFSEMNRVYQEYFPDNPPARTCIGVSDLVGKDWKVEIEFISTI